MNANLKRYIISSALTFVATFAAAILPSIGDLQFTKAAIVALIMVGLRAGIKALFEFLATIKSFQISDKDLES